MEAEETAPKRRKIIDIPEDTFRYLSIKAAANGVSLKRYIETLLAKDVEDLMKASIYQQLTQQGADELVPANEEELKEFRKWLRNKRQ